MKMCADRCPENSSADSGNSKQFADGVKGEFKKRFLNEREVSEFTGKALSTLRNDRAAGIGIRFGKDGRRVFYDLADVEDYMLHRKIALRSDT
jgi:hypothetical protein